jgi:hypothetical protein
MRLHGYFLHPTKKRDFHVADPGYANRGSTTASEYRDELRVIGSDLKLADVGAVSSGYRLFLRTSCLSLAADISRLKGSVAFGRLRTVSRI